MRTLRTSAIEAEHAFRASSGGVVVRLRATFALVLSLLLVALAFGAQQLTRLHRSESVVVDRLVPALVGSQELEGQLSAFLRLGERLRSARTEAALVELHAGMRALGARIVDTARQPSLDPDVVPALESLERDIRASVESVAEWVATGRELIDLAGQSDRSRARVRELGSEFRALIQPRLIDGARTLENGGDRTGDRAAASSDVRIAGLIDRQVNLTEAASRVASIVARAEQLARAVDLDAGGIDASTLSFDFQGVARILAALPDDDFRVAAARLASELRERVIGETGIHRTQQERARLRDGLASNQAELSAATARASKDIASAVADTRRGVLAASARFDRVLAQTAALFALVSLSVVAVVALASWFVVERQINRRVSRLTGSILDVAAGRIDTEVGVEGSDEIAAMARALETFKDNARQLERSNRELEQFAYAAAHDLKSPLRSIENLAEWTLEDHDDLPEGCTENMVKILRRAKRMAELQDSLLEYSQAGHAEAPLEEIDPAKLVEEQAELLDSEGRFPVTVEGDVRPLLSYATPLRQVLLNLMSNAIKHHDRESGELRVRIRQHGARMTVSVSDDGPGIAPEYQEKVFKLFQRLQTQDAVEGSGLGLSLVRKLVERYGGTITVVSDPESSRGAAFTFDWPRSDVLPALELAA